MNYIEVNFSIKMAEATEINIESVREIIMAELARPSSLYSRSGL
jgi:hypothetical protein